MQKNTMTLYLVDNETGVLYEDKQIHDGDTVKVVRYKTAKQKETIDNRHAKERFSRSLGGFTIMFYFNNKKLFCSNDDCLIKNKANITRLMMLATFMDFDNKLVLNIDGSATDMKPKDIKQQLQLNDSTFKKFWCEAKQTGIVYKDGNGWKLSDEWFYRGELKDTTNTKNYTKVYNDTIKQLYIANGTKDKAHTVLSYVIQLIPCIHFNTNFISTNPHEAKPQYMSMSDICTFLGISTDKGNISKLKKEFFKLRVNYNDKQYFLFNQVLFSGDTRTVERWMINPLMVNSMANIKDINNSMDSLFVYN